VAAIAGKIRHLLYLLVLFNVSIAHCLAQSATEISSTFYTIRLTQNIEVYEDKTKSLTIEQISGPKYTGLFKPLNSQESNLGFSTSVYWLKFSVNNVSNEANFYLSNNYQTIQHFDLYTIKSQKNQLSSFYQRSGFLTSIEEKAFPSSQIIFPLQLIKNVETQFYIRIETITPIIIDLLLQSEASFGKSETYHNTFIGIFFGVMSILLLVNLLFYFILKIRSLFYLAVYISATLGTFLIYDGFLLAYIPSALIKHQTMLVMSCGTIAAFFLFFYLQDFLLNKLSDAQIGKIKISIYTYLVVFIALAYFAEHPILYRLYLYSHISLSFSFLFYSGYIWFKGQQHARFVFFGLTCLTFSYLIQMTHLFGQTDDVILLVKEASRFGIILLTTLLSIAIVDYVRAIAKKQHVSEYQRKQAEKKFKQIFEQSYQMMFIVSRQGQILSANYSATQFLKRDKSDLFEKKFYDVFPSLRGVFDQDITKSNITKALEGELSTQAIVAYATDGTLKDLEVSYQPFIEEDNLATNLVIQVRDVTKQKHAFKAIQDMVVGIAGLSTDNFFRNFLIEISRIYNAKYVLLSQLNDTTPQTATSIAFIENKKIIQNISYVIEGSPSERLLEKHLCNYPKDAKLLFPKDEWLSQYNIESYLGANIKDQEGNIIGFLTVMDDKPMHEGNYFIEVLDVFAARIANELRQQESQDALKEALEKLDFHIKNTPLGVIEWDTNFHITKWNRAAEKIFGYSIDHFSNKNPIQVLAPKNEINEIVRLSQDLLINKKAQYNLTKNITAEGKLILCEWYNTPLLDSNENVIGIASLVNDVTAEHDALNALYIKEQEQREIFNALMDAVFIIDQKGNIISMNNTATTLFGYSTEELIGQSAALLLPEKYAQNYEYHLEKLLKTDHSKLLGVGRDILGLTQNGKVFPIHLTINKLSKDKSGNIRLIATCHDLTEFKQQQETLRQSQKMDALGNLTGGIAHDFNNLLGIINGYAELLIANIEPSSKSLKYANHIQNASARGAKLTQKLLSFSRKHTAETELVNVNNILTDEMEMLQKTITPRIQLTYSLKDHLPETNIDKAELQDCILNLVINAMHAIKESGEIIISSDLEKIGKSLAKLHNISPGQFIALAIKDNGCGMDSTTKEKALEPFFSTKGNSGTGLGLSQVYGFVERSNGFLDINSQLAQGTKITLYLPVSTRRLNKTIQSKPVMSNTSSGGSILVVDDEPALVELSSTILTQSGYTVTGANSAKEALNYLRKNEYSLILCDIIMPNMGGLELSKIIKKEFPDMPILFISGYYDNIPDSEKAFLEQNILKKPYQKDELLSKVSTLLTNKADKVSTVVT